MPDQHQIRRNDPAPGREGPKKMRPALGEQVRGAHLLRPFTARKWLSEVGAAIEGIMAKRLDLAYQPGRRGPAMLKYKKWNTVDCVVGGFTYAEPSRVVDALLLGLYDDDGALHYVGNARVTRDGEVFGRVLSALKAPSAFTGRQPSSRNRWTGAIRNPVYIRPQLVAEVSSERVTANFFRHGARLLRWRTDKRPDECRLDQLDVLGEKTTIAG